MAIGGAQAEILADAAAALLEQRVEAGAVAIPVEGMEHVEPAGRRPLERAARAGRAGSRPRG